MTSRPLPPRPSAAVPALLALLATLVPAFDARAQGDDLALRFDAEAAVVEANLERVIAAHERVAAAAQRMEQHGTRVRQGLGDPEVSVAQLRRADAGLMTALLDYERTMRRAATERERLYGSMDRLARIGERLGRDQDAVARGDVAGRWQVQVDGQGTFGVMVLRREGAAVAGTYRLSNGASGSVGGTFANGTLELERTDRIRGRDARITATLAPGATTMTGVWQPYEIGTGGPSLAGWTARRLGPAEGTP